MGMMQGLQEAMAASKVEQERMHADLTASQARNDELHRANEELRRRWRDVDEPETATPPREFSMPFSQAILEAAIPNSFTGPIVTFAEMENPEAHLTAFHMQMMLRKRPYEARRTQPRGRAEGRREGNRPLSTILWWN